MKKQMFSLGPISMLGGLLLGGVAIAGSWTDFGPSFESFPCQDGWAACVVNDTVVSPGMVLDGQGRPHPAGQRIGFFAFDALPSISPFEALSAYPEAGVAPPPRPAATLAMSDPQGADSAVPISDAPVSDAPVPVVPIGGAPVASAPVTEVRDSTYPADDQTARVADPVERPTRPVRPLMQPANETPADDPVVVADTELVNAAPKGVECSDLIALEAPAMLGTLEQKVRSCLENRLGGSAAQTTKKKVSLVLIQDAEAREDGAEWERLIRRHLQDIDRSDPTLCFRYAIHLSRQGRSSSVIKWADYALENKQQWSGTTYKRNVIALYKLRALAANRVWQAAEQSAIKDRSDSNKSKAEKWRGRTKSYAREWLDYARASGQDDQGPLSVCVSAAGSRDYCEG